MADCMFSNVLFKIHAGPDCHQSGGFARDSWKLTAQSQLNVMEHRTVFRCARQAKIPRGIVYATSTHLTRDIAGVCGPRMAVAVETTLRTAAGRHHHRAGEFQALFPTDYGPAGVPFPVAAAMVVVPKITTTFEEDK